MPRLDNVLAPIELTLDQLLLDPNNPRFADFGELSDPVPESRISEERVQRDTLERMKTARFDVAELRDTIKTVGFLPVDRIIVRAWGGNKEGQPTRYVVVEGNRRVAALRWLNELHETGRETFTDDQIHNFTHLSALLLNEVQAGDTARWVLPGLRHVSGIKEWGPYQRARAVHILRESGQGAQEAAQSIGLSTRAANQLWRSYLALEQMRADEEFGELVNPRMYSYFEEVFKRPNVRDWLAWSDNDGKFMNTQRLREFYGWIVGEVDPDEEDGERREPKFTEAKNVRDLSRFIDDEAALAIFRSPEGSLTRALSRYDAEHQQEWQGSIASATATLASLTPDTLRAITEGDSALLHDLKERLERVLKDRSSLMMVG
jgi:hypothetical protein